MAGTNLMHALVTMFLVEKIEMGELENVLLAAEMKSLLQKVESLASKQLDTESQHEMVDAHISFMDELAAAMAYHF